MYASSSDTFYKYYSQAQRGGALGSVDGIPVFRASSRRHVQGGAGLGDILRNAFRWFLPVAMRGASTFANQFLKSHDAGATFREAAKSAIGPTLGVAGEAIKSRIEARAKQQEADKAAAAAAASGDAPKSRWSSFLGKQTGTGRKRHRRRVYKGKAKRRKVGSAKKRKQVGLGRRRSTKAKKQRGGKKRKAPKRHRRRRHRTAATHSIASYNF